MSGNRNKMPDDVGLDNCVIGLKRVLGYAEEKKVTLIMEGLNSKVDHKDYQCDHTAWGVELCKQVGSERFKLLYDIYHMQIMEGDVRTLRAAAPHIALSHRGRAGSQRDRLVANLLPGRDGAIVRTGFKGFVAQEFIEAARRAGIAEAGRADLRRVASPDLRRRGKTGARGRTPVMKVPLPLWVVAPGSCSGAGRWGFCRWPCRWRWRCLARRW
jgi:hypothetical protein